MNRAIEFLQEHKDVVFATLEADAPRLRVLRMLAVEGDSAFFTTAPRKALYQQLQQNPQVEFIAVDKDVTVRVEGKVIFDVPDEKQRTFFAITPILSELYQCYTDLVYFRVKMNSMELFDLSKRPPYQEIFHV